jgi:CHAT domain-containing protein
MGSCGRRNRSSEVLYEQASHAFLNGELKQAQDEAQSGYKEFQNSSPQWAWRFRILQAKSALWRGLYEDVLKILDFQSSIADRPEISIPRLALVGVANVYLHDFSKAQEALNQATNLCENSESKDCGDVIQARGFLASEQKQSDTALKFYELSLSFANSHDDLFLKSTSLLNLGDELLSQGRFDESIDRSQSAYKVAKAINAKAVEFVISGNLGWAYYQLGDSEKALSLSLEAYTLATQLQDISNQENQLTNIGYIYLDRRQFEKASVSFQRALDLAKSIKAQQDMYNVLRVLARLSLQTGDLDKASYYGEQALKIATDSRNHQDELYPMLVQGQVVARRGDPNQARRVFEAIEHDQLCPVFLKWEAQHSLARLREDAKQVEAADGQYRAALTTFESARAIVQREDFQLSFLTNAAHIYDDYVHFLVAQGKTEDALRRADYSRARTLLEGLGVLARGASAAAHADPPALKPLEIARQTKAVILFYWLGERQSYLWAVTPQNISLFPLPPGADIDSMVQRYRAALNGPQELLQSGEDGRSLYRVLIAPAQHLLANDAKVLIIPDGSLNNLNFETLIVADPHPHFWIEDADIANASSLRVLAASLAARSARAGGKKRERRLLLIGDSIAPSKEYPELQRAAQQMTNVARHFPSSQETVYQRDQATPAAFLASGPEKFSHIHFVAHGTASRLSPLDSAIVLSKSATETDSFKLYARDIVPLRLNSDLVTISACYGAGERAYSGEGMVGLAWAFLRAGAHNVIAGLWEVTDASTEQLMDRFYDELDKGSTPDAALRAAKLSLLHGSPYHNPFYWAPFQLYTGA